LRDECTPVPKPRFKAARLLIAGFAAADRIADNFSDLESILPDRVRAGRDLEIGQQTAGFVRTAGSARLLRISSGAVLSSRKYRLLILS
jgi:hypothetical protein